METMNKLLMMGAGDHLYSHLGSYTHTPLMSTQLLSQLKSLYTKSGQVLMVCL